MPTFSEPTSKNCSENSVVFKDDGKIGYAIWYPQMGGYVGRAIAVMDESWSESAIGIGEGGCVDVYVWHNGEFPFDGESNGVSPVLIHHCDPKQFIEFGETLDTLNTRGRNKLIDKE